MGGAGRGQSRSSPRHWGCLGDGQSTAWSPAPWGAGSGSLVGPGTPTPSALALRNLLLARGFGAGGGLRGGVVLKHFGVLQHLSDQGGHGAWDLHLQGDGPLCSYKGQAKRLSGGQRTPSPIPEVPKAATSPAPPRPCPPTPLWNVQPPLCPLLRCPFSVRNPCLAFCQVCSPTWAVLRCHPACLLPSSPAPTPRHLPTLGTLRYTTQLFH